MSYLYNIAKTHHEFFTMKLFVERARNVKNRGDLTSGRVTRQHIEKILIDRGILQPAVESRWQWLLSLLPWCAKSPYQAKPLPPAKNVLLLVCGPEPMITSVAGPRPKPTSDFQLGMLGELGFKAENVRRL